jgi:hypothetical protein
MAKKRPYVLVRIKTFNRGLGHLSRRYTYQGKRFDIDHGWYKVGRGMGAELAKVRHPSSSAEIFDIVELEQAQELVESEAHEPWAQGQMAPDRSPEVKLREFKRRQEIKDARAALAESEDEGWDDIPARSASRATEPPVEVAMSKPSKKASKKVTKNTDGKKKKSGRRSASK